MEFIVNILKPEIMITVKNILEQKEKHFNTINPEASVMEAIGLMKTENLSYVIVMENGKYVGILTERDYSRKVDLVGKASSSTKVREIMTTDVPVVNLEDSTNKCMELMEAFRISYLPAFEGFLFKGVITLHDLLKEALEMARDKKNQLKAKTLGTLNDARGSSLSFWS